MCFHQAFGVMIPHSLSYTTICFATNGYAEKWITVSKHHLG
jgi:hypothetical protein